MVVFIPVIPWLPSYHRFRRPFSWKIRCSKFDSRSNFLFENISYKWPPPEKQVASWFPTYKQPQFCLQKWYFPNLFQAGVSSISGFPRFHTTMPGPVHPMTRFSRSNGVASLRTRMPQERQPLMTQRSKVPRQRPAMTRPWQGARCPRGRVDTNMWRKFWLAMWSLKKKGMCFDCIKFQFKRKTSCNAAVETCSNHEWNRKYVEHIRLNILPKSLMPITWQAE